ncbi:nucleoside deaminase [Sporosarcina sp. CAU 1771]
MTHEKWLQQTIQMAVDNVKQGEGPFAAIVVKDGVIIGRGTNQVLLQTDPSAHAELLAIREACKVVGTTDLSDCVLYASGEPCPMCLGASYWANVGAIYYACSKTDAATEADFNNPLHMFFSDQSQQPEQRKVPFVHLKTENYLDPFTLLNQRK